MIVSPDMQEDDPDRIPLRRTTSVACRGGGRGNGGDKRRAEAMGKGMGTSRGGDSDTCEPQ